MSWLEPVGGYCERLAPGFGAEPLNMLTGLAFLVAGLVALARAPAAEDRLAAGALAAIGPVAALHHGFAVTLTLWADVLANQVYLFCLGSLMLRRLAGAGWSAALAGAAVLVAGLWSAIHAPLLQRALGMGSDLFALGAGLLLGTALALRRRHPATARGVALAALLLAAGLPFRLLDAALCPVWPAGTHALWHLMNAGAAAVLFAALARHPVASPLAKAGTPG